MSRLLTIRHHAPVHRLKICSTEATVVTTTHATEVFARVAPIASGSSRNRCLQQAQVIYESLSDLLAQHRAGLGDVVTERVFLRDLARDWDDFQQVRAESYRRRGITGRLLPAMTSLGQPPCRSGQDVELLVYAVVPSTRGNARVESLPTAGQHTTAKLVQIGPSQHLHLSSLVGQDSNGSQREPLRQQIAVMWANLLGLLGGRGDLPVQVLRASVYLSDIERDFAELLDSHGEFLQQQDFVSWPVAAILGGGLYPPGALCGLDLHALLNPEVARIEPMHRRVVGEALPFPSAVEGVKIVLEEHTYLFLSATVAAMDTAGSAHEVIVPAVEQIIAEIRELLRVHGADVEDLVQVVTRLKSASLALPYDAMCGPCGLKDVPHALVQAGFSRPEQLAELELTAIVASP